MLGARSAEPNPPDRCQGGAAAASDERHACCASAGHTLYQGEVVMMGALVDVMLSDRWLTWPPELAALLIKGGGGNWDGNNHCSLHFHAKMIFTGLSARKFWVALV